MQVLNRGTRFEREKDFDGPDSNGEEMLVSGAPRQTQRLESAERSLLPMVGLMSLSSLFLVAR